MKGDQFKTMAEYADTDKRSAYAQKAMQAYEDGLNITKKALFPKAHPLLLGIIINYSVLNYEVLKK
jgi:hypothetical protein